MLLFVPMQLCSYFKFLNVVKYHDQSKPNYFLLLPLCGDTNFVFLFKISVKIFFTFKYSFKDNSLPFVIHKVGRTMVALGKVSMLLGGAHALHSETVHQLATDKGIIGQKEVAKIGAGMAAFAGIRAGASAIGASTSSISDSSLSGSSHASSGDDGGSRTCYGFIIILQFQAIQTANLKSYASFVHTIVLFLLNFF